MQTDELRCLAALAQHPELSRAAQALQIDVAQVRQVIARAEHSYGTGLVAAWTAAGDPQFSADGLRVLQGARQAQLEMDTLRRDLEQLQLETAVAPLTERRSVSPKRLGLPGPSAAAVQQMLQAALSAPDHGSLRPWRVIDFARDAREQLAACFAEEKLRRDPLTSVEDLARARAHALRPPVLLGFVVTPVSPSAVPLREQWLSAGAALGNLLNAAHQLGFGAIVLSGDRCFDPLLTCQLGLQEHESLAGFVSIGTVISAPVAQRPARPTSVPVLSQWGGPGAGRAADAEQTPARCIPAAAVQAPAQPLPKFGA